MLAAREAVGLLRLQSLTPIRWEEWGERAFERSQAEGKPILLSLTARWCHACHRMDEETWEDPGVAALVERVAVPVDPPVLVCGYYGCWQSWGYWGPPGYAVRTVHYREGSIVFDLEIIDRVPGVRPKNSVDLAGIDPQSLQGGLNRPDFVVAELEVVAV